MFKNYQITVILVAFLVGVTAFSVFKYISALKEKNSLSQALNLAKEQVTALESEKQDLLETIEKEKSFKEQISAENLQLKDTLKATQDKLAKFEADLAQAQKTVEQLNAELSTLKIENTTLKQEKENLQSRLSSLKELKKAIREVKIKQHQEKIYLHQLKISNLKQADLERLAKGNRGFLVKGGKATYPGKVRIEVVPAPATE